VLSTAGCRQVICLLLRKENAVTDARHGVSRPNRSAPYARGTRVDPERSRRELEGFLARRGASNFVVVQDDASARVRFALYGNYFELVLPLPDPQGPTFSHTPTGRPRTPAAQHRAYEQAVREKWRSLVLVAKGKLEAVESGISSVEQEFAVGYVPAAEWNGAAHAAASGEGGALRRVSRTIVGALGAGLLVPASALSALALPDAAVDRVAGVVWGDQPALFVETEASPGTLTLPEPADGAPLVLSVPPNDGAHFTLAVASPAGGEAATAPARGGSSSGDGGKDDGAKDDGAKGGGKGGGGSSSGSGSAGSSAGVGGGDSGGGTTVPGGGGSTGGGSGGPDTPGDAPGNSEWGHQQGKGNAWGSGGSVEGTDKAPKSR
jgi:hypothetical protein